MEGLWNSLLYQSAENLEVWDMYDRNILNEVANSRNVDVAPLHEYDEERISRIFHRTIRGMSTHISDHVAQLQFDFLKEKAETRLEISLPWLVRRRT